jgi:hypothetical protein
LIAFGVQVEKQSHDVTLFIVDAQQGYFGATDDIEGTLKLAFTLASRARKENRSGLTWLGDMSSFFTFENNISKMMDYELLSCPQKYEDEMIKTVCSLSFGGF